MKTISAFLLGVLLVLVIGATTDDTLRRISATLERIAQSLEILAKQPRR